MGDLPFHVASFWSQRVWAKPAETHMVLQQEPLAPPASPAARVAWGKSPAAQDPCCPLVPATAYRQDVFLLESQLFWVRPGHESSLQTGPGAAPCRAKATLPAAAIAFLSAPPSCRRCHRHRPRSAAGCRSGRRRSRSWHDGEGGCALWPQKPFFSRL